MGADAGQVRRWEAGRGLGDSIEERRELAEAIAEATDAPRSFLGLPDAGETVGDGDRLSGLSYRSFMPMSKAAAKSTISPILSMSTTSAILSISRPRSVPWPS